MDHMSFSKLKDHLSDSSRTLADLTVQMAYENPALINDLTELALSEISPYAQRAARVIAILSLQHPELFIPIRGRVIKKLKTLHNESVVRNLLQIYSEIPISYTKTEQSVLVNMCFDYLGSQTAPVSIKVYSMEILFRISKKIPDIGIELYSLIESQMTFSSAGFKSRGQKILLRLAK